MQKGSLQQTEYEEVSLNLFSIATHIVIVIAIAKIFTEVKIFKNKQKICLLFCLDSMKNLILRKKILF